MRGTELKQTIDASVRKVQEGVNQAQDRVRQAGRRVNELTQVQAEQAERLAQVVLEHLDETQGDGATLQLLRRAMEAKAQESERLGRQERVFRERLDACQRALARAQEETVAADVARNDLEAQAESQMLGQEVFERAKSQRDELSEQIGNAKEKLLVARKDAQDKVPHYLSDPFFSYLLDRGYGQDGYRAGALTRALDGWVARLVQFNRYYPDFQRLKAIPEKIQDHIQWLEDKHADLSARLEEEHQRILREQMPEYGKAVEGFLAARVNEEALEAEILDMEEKLQTLGEAMLRIARGTDPHTAQATHLIKQVVLGGGQGRARKLVEASRTQEDDEILRRIQDLDADIQQAQGVLNDANRECEQMRSHLVEVENFHRRFQNSGMGRANRRHPSLRKSDVTEAILAGYGLAGLLRKMESQVRTISSSPSYPTTSSGSSRSSSSSWPSRRSSSSGMGGFGGSRGRTGGGFGGSRGRTGGGF